MQTVSNRELRDIIFRNIKSSEDRKRLYQYLINLVQSPIEGWDVVKRIFQPLDKRKFIDNVKELSLFNGEYDADFQNTIDIIENNIQSQNKPYISFTAGEDVLTWVGYSKNGDVINKEILFSKDGKTYRLKSGVGIVQEDITSVEQLPTSDINFEFYHLIKNETHIDPDSGELIIDRYAGFYTPTSSGWETVYEIKNKYTNIEKLTNFAYKIEYDEIDYEGAAKYLEEHYTDYPVGACSAIVKDNIVGTNFDWYLSNNSEFVIHTNKNGFRQEVLGIAGNIKGITDELIDTKDYKKQFDYLPCLIESGINSAGLIMKMNVVPVTNNHLALPTKHTNWGLPKVCGLMLVRMVLDKCKNIDEALDYIQNKIDIYMPYNENFQQEIHYLLTDGNKTYSIATQNVQVIVTDITEHPLLTNFRINGVTIGETVDINTVEEYGMGVERYDNMLSSYGEITEENIMEHLASLKYSTMYTETSEGSKLPMFKTEFTGIYPEGDNLMVTSPVEAFERVFGVAKEKHEAADRDAEDTWITTHSVVYNNNDKTIKICFQENYNKVFTFELINKFGNKIDYNKDVINKPTINEVEVDGDKKFADYGLIPNPAGKASINLNKIKIDGVIYDTTGNPSLVFPNILEVVTYFNAKDKKGNKVGLNIYINTVEVPDLWISKNDETTSVPYTYVDDDTFVTDLHNAGDVGLQVGYFRLNPLETQKVVIPVQDVQTPNGTSLVEDEIAKIPIISTTIDNEQLIPDETGNVEIPTVRTDKDQSLTSTQQKQARRNIGALDLTTIITCHNGHSLTLQEWINKLSDLIWWDLYKGEIYYITVDGDIAVPYKEESFDVPITFNTYGAEGGTIEFDGELTVIGQEAFYSVDNLKSITIPNTVVTLGTRAFEGCDNLESVTLSENIVEIGSNAFSNCKVLNNIVLPEGLKVIKSDAFYMCDGLTSITIPDSVTTIEYAVFNHCINLNYFKLGKNAQYVDYDILIGCLNLETIIVDENNSWYDSRNNCNAIVETYQNRLISGCKNTIIPNTVVAIGRVAFSQCKNLESIEIPSSVATIEFNAFTSCTALNTVTVLREVPPTMEMGVFAFCTNLTSIFVPADSVDAYKAAQGWKDYADIIKPIV